MKGVTVIFTAFRPKLGEGRSYSTNLQRLTKIHRGTGDTMTNTLILYIKFESDWEKTAKSVAKQDDSGFDGAPLHSLHTAGDGNAFYFQWADFFLDKYISCT